MSKCSVFKKKEERVDVNSDNYIELRNVKNRVIKNKEFKGGELQILIKDCENITIENCKFSGVRSENGHAILVYNPVNLIIKNCSFTDMRCGNSEVVAIHSFSGGYEILNNSFKRVDNICIDIIHGEGNSDEVERSQGIIRGNYIDYQDAQRSDYWTSAIYSDGSSDIVIENNFVKNSSLGIEIGSENKGATAKNIVVRDNVLDTITKVGVLLGSEKKRSGGVEDVLVEDNEYINVKKKTDEQYNCVNCEVEK